MLTSLLLHANGHYFTISKQSQYQSLILLFIFFMKQDVF